MIFKEEVVGGRNVTRLGFEGSKLENDTVFITAVKMLRERGGDGD